MRHRLAVPDQLGKEHLQFAPQDPLQAGALAGHFVNLRHGDELRDWNSPDGQREQPQLSEATYPAIAAGGNRANAHRLVLKEAGGEIIEHILQGARHASLVFRRHDQQSIRFAEQLEKFARRGQRAFPLRPFLQRRQRIIEEIEEPGGQLRFFLDASMEIFGYGQTLSTLSDRTDDNRDQQLSHRGTQTGLWQEARRPVNELADYLQARALGPLPTLRRLCARLQSLLAQS